MSRVDYMCTSQEHELKALSDRMCDLGQLKETVKVTKPQTLFFSRGLVPPFISLFTLLFLDCHSVVDISVIQHRLYHCFPLFIMLKRECKQNVKHFVVITKKYITLTNSDPDSIPLKPFRCKFQHKLIKQAKFY